MKQAKKNLPIYIYSGLMVLFILGLFFYLGRYKVISVETMALNVRTGPGINNDIKTQTTRGDKLTILEEENNWYKVRLPNQKVGWIAAWLANGKNAGISTNINAMINTNNTKLREEPTTESKIVKEYSEGTKVVVTVERNGWSKVEIGSEKGWIRSSLLNLTNQEKQDHQKSLYARENDTVIRKNPDPNGEILTKLNYGEVMALLEQQGDWYKIKLRTGEVGYVANWSISMTQPKDVKKRKPVTSNLAEATIMLDAGHGGNDGGAQTSAGKLEKDLSLQIAKTVKKELEKTGANVLMTRSKDDYVSLEERVQVSKSKKPDLFISMHLDSTEQKDGASGVTTYYYDKKRDKEIGAMINKHLKKDLPLENRGVKFGDWYVTRENSQPALLIELGYLNNDNDASEVTTKNYRTKVAKAITEALKEYYQ